MGKINLSIYDENNCTLFALGRNAMYASCLALRLKAGDEVLTPAFDCDGSLQPFRVMGLKLSYYRSNPGDFSVDLEDLKLQITDKTKLMHVINHFGMPQPWDKLLAIKEKTGIPILEDNAYSLFSSSNGKMFGTFGDMAIFSLRKNLPLPDGGLLRVNNKRYLSSVPISSIKASPLIYRYEIIDLCKLIKNKMGFKKIPSPIFKMAKLIFSNIEQPPPLSSDSDGSYYWQLRDKIDRVFTHDYLRRISKVAEFMLNSFSSDYLTEVAQKKIFYYHYLVTRLSEIEGLRLLWPQLPEGAVPFCVNFLAGPKRDALFFSLRRHYNIMAWPTLSRDVLSRIKEFPEVETLGRNILQINLDSESVIKPDFSRYLDNLIKDIKLNLTKTGI